MFSIVRAKEAAIAGGDPITRVDGARGFGTCREDKSSHTEQEMISSGRGTDGP